MKLIAYSVLVVFSGIAPLIWAQTPASKPAAPSARKTALDKPTFEAYVRHLELFVPELQLKIDDPKPSTLPGFLDVIVHLSYNGNPIKDIPYLVSNDGKRIIRGTVLDIDQNPFKTQTDIIRTDLQPSFGTPGAQLVLVMFSDFECPLCKEEAKVLRQNLLKSFPTQVRVYFKDYPLEAIHPWAKTAAIAGRCVFRQNPAAFWDYFDWMYEHQGDSDITPATLKQKVLDFAATKQLDTAKLGTCIDTRATDAEVNKSMAEGRALQIDATPTIFLNGRPVVGNLPWQNLENLIKFELEYQKVAANAGEKCCTVEIPSILKK